MSETLDIENASRRNFLRGSISPAPAPLAWSDVADLPSGAGDVFWSAYTIDDEVFIVGDDGVILHFDGETWQRQTTESRSPLHAVHGHTLHDLRAVGWMGGIYRKDGSDWRLERGCVVGEDGKYAPVEENTPLFGLVGDGEGHFIAVGDHGTILYFDGQSWNREDSGREEHLRAVALLGDGWAMAAGAGGAVLMRSPEGEWSSLDCPVKSNFQSIAVVSPNEIYLAGGRYFIDANGFRGEMVSWREGLFEKIVPDRPFSRLRALAPYREGVLAVGDKGQIHFVRRNRAYAQPVDTLHDILGVTVSAAGEAIAVGDFGTVLHSLAEPTQVPLAPSVQPGEPAPNWEVTPSGTDRQLWGVWHDPRSGIAYACGEEGVVLRQDGDTWERLPSVGAIGLRSICEADDGGILAAGQLGEIYHFDGQSWRKHFDLLMDVTILSLWSDGAGQAFAVGDDGYVFRWDGKEWARMPSGTRSALYSIWGVDAEHLLAVGDFGMVLRWNGKSWDEFNAGTESFLFGVWGSALDNVFVVGLQGTIGHFDGKRWTLTPARARSDLLAISGGPDGVVAVGAAGTALHHDGRRWRIESSGFDGGLRAVSAAGTETFAVGDGGTILRRR